MGAWPERGCMARAWVHGQSVGAWQHGCMAAWVHGSMGAWQHGCMAAWVHGSMAAWVHGSMGAWQHGCMGAGTNKKNPQLLHWGQMARDAPGVKLVKTLRMQSQG